MSRTRSTSDPPLSDQASVSNRSAIWTIQSSNNKLVPDYPPVPKVSSTDDVSSLRGKRDKLPTSALQQRNIQTASNVSRSKETLKAASLHDERSTKDGYGEKTRSTAEGGPAPGPMRVVSLRSLVMAFILLCMMVCALVAWIMTDLGGRRTSLNVARSTIALLTTETVSALMRNHMQRVRDASVYSIQLWRQSVAGYAPDGSSETVGPAGAAIDVVGLQLALRLSAVPDFWGLMTFTHLPGTSTASPAGWGIQFVNDRDYVPGTNSFNSLNSTISLQPRDVRFSTSQLQRYRFILRPEAASSNYSLRSRINITSSTGDIFMDTAGSTPAPIQFLLGPYRSGTLRSLITTATTAPLWTRLYYWGNSTWLSYLYPLVQSSTPSNLLGVGSTDINITSTLYCIIRSELARWNFSGAVVYVMASFPANAPPYLDSTVTGTTVVTDVPLLVATTQNPVASPITAAAYGDSLLTSIIGQISTTSINLSGLLSFSNAGYWIRVSNASSYAQVHVVTRNTSLFLGSMFSTAMPGTNWTVIAAIPEPAIYGALMQNNTMAYVVFFIVLILAAAIPYYPVSTVCWTLAHLTDKIRTYSATHDFSKPPQVSSITGSVRVPTVAVTGPSASSLFARLSISRQHPHYLPHHSPQSHSPTNETAQSPSGVPLLKSAGGPDSQLQIPGQKHRFALGPGEPVAGSQVSMVSVQIEPSGLPMTADPLLMRGRWLLEVFRIDVALSFMANSFGKAAVELIAFNDRPRPSIAAQGVRGGSINSLNVGPGSATAGTAGALAAPQSNKARAQSISSLNAPAVPPGSKASSTNNLRPRSADLPGDANSLLAAGPESTTLTVGAQTRSTDRLSG